MAQHTGYKPIENPNDFKKQFAAESERVHTITSNFTQEKVLTALTEKITSSGQFWFSRSNKIRLEYKKPFSYVMIMNDGKLLVRDDQKETRINVNSNKLFQQVNRIIVDCVQGTILTSKDFTTRVFENEKTYLLEMTPASKTLKDFFLTIVLVVERADYSVTSIRMNEPTGDYTIMTFREKKLNVPVPDAVFTF
ncbi:MAG: outer membrane lipoprotein carrier protein LolA [Cyclobacteriaceae bacterium]|nr:outer membrane lipoprotein carrier protein LolA [Cyclobacteriaceae bacterium]